jgi:hypothetical protein
VLFLTILIAQIVNLIDQIKFLTKTFGTNIISLDIFFKNWKTFQFVSICKHPFWIRRRGNKHELEKNQI